MSKAYDRNTDKIETKVGEEFSIELESNPTTGYQWQEDFNTRKLKLVDKKFASSAKTIGASGKEILTFKALEVGKSTIKLNYKRSWESDSLENIEIELHSSEG